MQWTSQRQRKTRIFSKLQVQNEISHAAQTFDRGGTPALTEIMPVKNSWGVRGEEEGKGEGDGEGQRCELLGEIKKTCQEYNNAT